MVKVLRPLSLINYNPNIYTVCKALWESASDILKVLFVIFIIWFLFYFFYFHLKHKIGSLMHC